MPGKTSTPVAVAQTLASVGSGILSLYAGVIREKHKREQREAQAKKLREEKKAG